jgi:hypothetical protein
LLLKLQPTEIVEVEEPWYMQASQDEIVAFLDFITTFNKNYQTNDIMNAKGKIFMENL